MFLSIRKYLLNDICTQRCRFRKNAAPRCPTPADSGAGIWVPSAGVERSIGGEPGAYSENPECLHGFLGHEAAGLKGVKWIFPEGGGSPEKMGMGALFPSGPRRGLCFPTFATFRQMAPEQIFALATTAIQGTPGRPTVGKIGHLRTTTAALPGFGEHLKTYGKHQLWSPFEQALKQISTQTINNVLPLYEFQHKNIQGGNNAYRKPICKFCK